MTNLPMKFRSRTEGDHNFIFASWMRSFRSNSQWAKQISSGIYNTKHPKLINELLANSGSIVACSSDMPDQIFGFAIYQPSVENIAVIHWLYVKEIYRKMGVGNALFRETLMAANHDLKMPVAVTHDSRNLKWASEKYNLVYNPYLAFEVFDAEGKEDYGDRIRQLS